MKSVIPLVIATAVLSTFAYKAISSFCLSAGESKQVIYIATDLPGDPYDPGPYGGNPHGGNPHGGDPHDENHDPGRPANDKELGRKNQDPYGGQIPGGPPY